MQTTSIGYTGSGHISEASFFLNFARRFRTHIQRHPEKANPHQPNSYQTFSLIFP